MTVEGWEHMGVAVLVSGLATFAATWFWTSRREQREEHKEAEERYVAAAAFREYKERVAERFSGLDAQIGDFIRENREQHKELFEELRAILRAVSSTGAEK